jgi:molecular chaperone GrpE
MSAHPTGDEQDRTAGASAEGSSSAVEQDAPRPAAELAAELAECKDRLLRALADQENARRRAQRERDEAVKFAASSLARDLLATADNLRRAIESVPEGQAAGEPVRQLLAGIVATERALLEALEKHGIRRIDVLGEPFDPERHEAVDEVVDDERPAGTVAAVLLPGYLHHERLLRPAMVGVARSGAAD